MSQSIGEYRVGSRFNPSGDTNVDKLKNAAAYFIDLCDEQRAEAMISGVPRSDGPSATDDQVAERVALYERVMREAESAAMWAVKAATKQERGEA